MPIVLLVLAALMKGMGIRTAGRVFGLDPNTVQSWLGAAAAQLSAFAGHFLVDLEPQQVQLDEVYASLAHLLETDSESVELKQGASWVWTAMDPVTKLLVIIVVGERSLRLPLAEPQPTRGKGSPKKWQQRTPAMATGLTDHIWSLREVLLYRVPPWPLLGAKV